MTQWEDTFQFGSTSKNQKTSFAYHPLILISLCLSKTWTFMQAWKMNVDTFIEVTLEKYFGSVSMPIKIWNYKCFKTRIRSLQHTVSTNIASCIGTLSKETTEKMKSRSLIQCRLWSWITLKTRESASLPTSWKMKKYLPSFSMIWSSGRRLLSAQVRKSS